MHSCIYDGTVSHRRYDPIEHEFQYRLFMLYLDLGELPSLIGRGSLIGTSKYASRAFLRSDHLFNKQPSLEDEVRGIVLQQTGHLPLGPIRMLSQLRYFGFYMSPLNLFYVHDERGERVDYVVAEVNNTPWKERHCYVLWDGNRDGDQCALQFSHPKQFHVSPFMDMEMHYYWHLSMPGERLTVNLANLKGDEKLFDACLSLTRSDLNNRQLRRMSLRFPMMTAQISAAIYYQALKLWWKKCPFYPHPRTQSNNAPPRRSELYRKSRSKTRLSR